MCFCTHGGTPLPACLQEPAATTPEAAHSAFEPAAAVPPEPQASAKPAAEEALPNGEAAAEEVGP